MGRDCGFLAMRSGIAAEADAILYGEDGSIGEDELVARLEAVLRKCFAAGGHKKRALIIKAEGVPVAAAQLAQRLQAFVDRVIPGVDVRTTVLGHVVRGGNPSALDRVIAQRLAFGAVIACEKGASDVMLGWDVPYEQGSATGDTHVRLVPLGEVLEESKRLVDGSSPVVQARLALLRQVQDILAL
jgi:6-phosphofructokinase 1